MALSALRRAATRPPWWGAAIASTRRLSVSTPHAARQEEEEKESEAQGRSRNGKGPLRVLFLGSDAFAEECLARLTQNLSGRHPRRAIDHVQVVCAEEVKSTGRRSKGGLLPVHRFALENHLHVHLAPRSPADRSHIDWPRFLEDSKQDPLFRFDVGVVVSFGHLLPRELLQAFPLGVVNVHPSLLPRYRGSSPVHHAVLNGDRTTGVSVVEVTPSRFDVGGVLLQRPVEVPPESTTESLTALLAERGADMLIEVLTDLEGHQEGKQEQAGEASLAPKVVKAMGHIDWARDSTARVHCMFRALGGSVRVSLSPAAKPGVRIGIVGLTPEAGPAPAACLEASPAETPPGTAYFSPRDKAVFVRSADGWVGVSDVQLPAKGKPQGAAVLANLIGLKRYQLSPACFVP